MMVRLTPTIHCILTSRYICTVLSNSNYLVRLQLSDVTVAPPIVGDTSVLVNKSTNTNNLQGVTVPVSLLINTHNSLL